MKQQIDFAEFLEIESKLEIKIGYIQNVEEVPKSNKLLRLTVDFGNEDIRTVVTNIKPRLADWTMLKGVMCNFVTNLKPVIMMGIESQAMIMPHTVGEELMFTFLTDNSTLGAKLI